ncbi:MAG: FAD-dependent oxidoreductase, partial [SAR324 cluster bacterium]|nr:FAD-dependent oxidoreductase [SAR324 cluster bacterium]
MARYDYNLIAVGAGAAGLVSSYIASAVKARAALIEKNLMGGDCLNYGCVPSKSLISSSKLVHQLNKHDRFGLKEVQYQVDFPLVMDRVQEIIKTITPHDSVERYTSLGVECIEGSARLVSPHQLEVNGNRLTTKNIVIATGASPAIPSIPGLEGSAYSTSDSIWKLRKLPKHLLVIGGGPIGCELAQAFRRLGSEVTILTRDRRLLPKEDRDLAELVLKNFESEGIRMQTEVQVDRIENKNSEQ